MDVKCELFWPLAKFHATISSGFDLCNTNISFLHIKTFQNYFSIPLRKSALIHFQDFLISFSYCGDIIHNFF